MHRSSNHWHHRMRHAWKSVWRKTCGRFLEQRNVASSAGQTYTIYTRTALQSNFLRAPIPCAVAALAARRNVRGRAARGPRIQSTFRQLTSTFRVARAIAARRPLPSRASGLACFALTSHLSSLLSRSPETPCAGKNCRRPTAGGHDGRTSPRGERAHRLRPQSRPRTCWPRGRRASP